MSNSAVLRQTISAIKRYGTTVVYTAVGEPVFDSGTRTQEAVETPYQGVKGVVDTTSMVTLGKIFGDGLVLSNDLNFMIPGGQKFTPKQTDYITLDGEKREVIAIKPVYFRNEVVLYHLLTRAGYRTGSRAALV